MMPAVSSIRGHASRPDIRAPGQQHGEHHDERVGHRRRDMGGVGMQAEESSSSAYCGSSVV